MLALLITRSYARLMTRYRRLRVEGGTFFFTLVLADRSSDVLTRYIDQFWDVYRRVQQQRPFKTQAICVLPDHLHAIWSLPEGDDDFSTRWSLIKGGLSRMLEAPSRPSRSKLARREKGIWQRRFWEHAIRNDADFERHVDYIHFNPVKHGLVSRVRDWPHSSFHRYVERELISLDWAGDLRSMDGQFGE